MTVTLTKEEKNQLAKVRQAKLEILFTSKDRDGNFLVYNHGMLNLRLVHEDKNRKIGDIYYVNDKIIYTKWENANDIFRKMNAWSIPLVVAKNVDVIWYKTPMQQYWITHDMIRQLIKEGEAKIMKFENVEQKVYVPIKYWSPDSLIKEEKYEMTLLAHNPAEAKQKETAINKYESRVSSWAKELFECFESNYMKQMGPKLAQARKSKTIYPEPSKVFRAFRMTPYESVKVVILGQDPYHDGNATGLAFDCGKFVTPTMEKISEGYDEQFPDNFSTDIMDGNLERWTKNGVLLINAALTVRKKEPGSHLQHWHPFTLEVIRALNRRSQEPYNLPYPVYILWGSFAHQYEQLLDDAIPRIKAEHPVAASYKKRKWKHNYCFIQANKELEKLGVEPIKW